ncbi:MAG: hypothetical protein FRX49_07643 [Trebouxia sp. A1-2]|nr:MAG: hypothetical protein FRX49_07643 [Trebouxia sp. A1-2]
MVSPVKDLLANDKLLFLLLTEAAFLHSFDAIKMFLYSLYVFQTQLTAAHQKYRCEGVKGFSGKNTEGNSDTPSQTHLTRPAMSTMSKKAGTSLFGLYVEHSHLKRSSGT